MSKKKVNLYLITLCLCFASPVFSEPIYSIPREIQYSFTLQNRTNRLLEKAEFWTYAPVKETSTQRCLNLEASHPYELILDDFGNQILYFRFDNLPPYSTKIITIKATLTLSEVPNPISMGNINAFLRAEKYIEIDNPELFQFSKNFKDLTPVKTAENIFRWVADNVYYAGYMRDERGALYALRNKRGDCTEFMYLFAALCRANNIPARGIGGYVCAENTILKPGSYHNWAEFYDEGSWKIADPQKKSFMQNQSHYIATRIIGESVKNPMGEYNRFRFEGEGLKVTMNNVNQMNKIL